MALTGILALGVGAFGSLALSIVGFSPAVGDFVSQSMYQAFGNRIPSAVDLIRAFQKGVIDEATFEDLMRQNGFNDERTPMMLEGSLDKLNVREVIILWFRFRKEPGNRFGINDKWLDERLRANGIDINSKQEFLEANRAVPSLDDIIRFAVRDVFDPEQARLAGLFEDLPELFVKEAEKRGMNREDANNFWAAHWFIPSTNQMIEMSQRLFDHPNPNVRFTQTDMIQGFKLADIAPGFRERLLHIAFNPLGRIDIRRADRFGLFGEGNERKTTLVRKFRELGFSPEDSNFQADFVIAQNDRREESGSVQEVLRFFREGIFTENSKTQALEMLKERGVPDDRAQLLIRLEQMKQITVEERKAIEEIKDNFMNGVIANESALRTQLANIPLTSSDVNKFMKEFKSEKNKQTKRISRSDADRLRRLGLLSLEQWKEVLRSDNLLEADITRLNQAFEESTTGERTLPSKSDTIGWYEGLLIDENDFLGRMRELGFVIDDIALFATGAGRPLSEEVLERN